MINSASTLIPAAGRPTSGGAWRVTALARSGDAARLRDSKHATPASAPPDCEICCRLVRNASGDAFPHNALIGVVKDTAIARRRPAAVANGKDTRKGRESISRLWECSRPSSKYTQVSPETLQPTVGLLESSGRILQLVRNDATLAVHSGGQWRTRTHRAPRPAVRRRGSVYGDKINKLSRPTSENG